MSRSRSTWACELKCSDLVRLAGAHSHAPRERVSWNLPPALQECCSACHAPRERVSWNGTIETAIRRFKSRSTWACELKYTEGYEDGEIRVSRSTWACELKSELLRGADHREAVTLHVRIWLVICMSRILRCVVYIVFS